MSKYQTKFFKAKLFYHIAIDLETPKLAIIGYHGEGEF